MAGLGIAHGFSCLCAVHASGVGNRMLVAEQVPGTARRARPEQGLPGQCSIIHRGWYPNRISDESHDPGVDPWVTAMAIQLAYPNSLSSQPERFTSAPRPLQNAGEARTSSCRRNDGSGRVRLFRRTQAAELPCGRSPAGEEGSAPPDSASREQTGDVLWVTRERERSPFSGYSFA